LVFLEAILLAILNVILKAILATSQLEMTMLEELLAEQVGDVVLDLLDVALDSALVCLAGALGLVAEGLQLFLPSGKSILHGLLGHLRVDALLLQLSEEGSAEDLIHLLPLHHLGLGGTARVLLNELAERALSIDLGLGHRHLLLGSGLLQHELLPGGRHSFSGSRYCLERS